MVRRGPHGDLSSTPSLLRRRNGHLPTLHRTVSPPRPILSSVPLLSSPFDSPSTLVPLLNRSLRMKGLHHGTWSLTSFEAEHHKGETHLPGAPRIVLVGLADPGSEADGRRRKYEFEMDLGLRCTQIGRFVVFFFALFQS